jgi:hypothetical protein
MYLYNIITTRFRHKIYSKTTLICDIIRHSKFRIVYSHNDLFIFVLLNAIDYDTMTDFCPVAIKFFAIVKRIQFKIPSFLEIHIISITICALDVEFHNKQ